MLTKLPYEVLEQIFTHPNISKKDLLQLQLTCKQWSPIAQKHVYRGIDIVDASLYGDKASDHDKMKERIRHLAQTLLFLNANARKWVRMINVGALLDPDAMTDSSQDPTLNLTTVAHLCPNITSITGRNFTPAFHDAVSNLHRTGDLQHLEKLSSPTYITDEKKEALIPSYSKAAIALKDTLKEITVFDGVAKNPNTIQLDCLQHFPCVQHLHLHEFSRVPLSRFGDHISNCCPKTRAISIHMETTTDDMEEDNDRSAVTSATQIQELAIDIDGFPLTRSDLAFVMRMFPSLQCLTFAIGEIYWEDIDPIQEDLEVVLQFVDYLLSIPRVEYNCMCFGVSEGLGLLTHLAESIDIQHLSVAVPDGGAFNALSVQLDRELEKVDTSTKTKHSSLTIDARPQDIQAFILDALVLFKDKPIDKLTFGHLYSNYDGTQKVDEESLDYLINNYVSLQELAFRDIEFPTSATHSSTSKAKSLRCLDLDYCILSDDYFTKLSSQLEHVDYFKYSIDAAYHTSYMLTRSGKKIRILMPYTTIHTAELTIGDLTSYIIRILTKGGCYVLKCCQDYKVSQTLEAWNTSEALPKDTHEVVVHCMRLKKVCVGSISFELPTLSFEQ